MHNSIVIPNQNAEVLGHPMSSTKALLRCSIAAGPVFLLIFAMEVIGRPEFHFSQTEPSLLSLGPWGWIQIANCVFAGLLTVGGAVGVRRVLRSVKGGFAGPLLLGVFGVCQAGEGVFVVDPVGSPEGMTFHGKMHILFGMTGFMALMASCFVFGYMFFSRRQKGWSIFCVLTGFLFLSGFLSAASVQSGDTTRIQLFLNLLFVLEWIWIPSISGRVLRNHLMPPTAQEMRRS
jgi:hypothetical protein